MKIESPPYEGGLIWGQDEDELMILRPFSSKDNIPHGSDFNISVNYEFC